MGGVGQRLRGVAEARSGPSSGASCMTSPVSGTAASQGFRAKAAGSFLNLVPSPSKTRVRVQEAHLEK